MTRRSDGALSEADHSLEIQQLRGLAVLLVLLYHAELPFLRAGYLGVDIFFVISGYLITRMVASGIANGTFSFREFDFRRAKRLLPAAYVAFAVTAAFTPWLLTSSELRDFAAQLFGSVTFTANIVLWRQSGYFEGTAALKPLLHVWSLSIEEQYYLLLPAALVFTPRRFWTWGACLVLVASLTLCLLTVGWRPSAAFYLLPTRCWELALGSMGALALTGPRARGSAKMIFWPAWGVLFAIPAHPLSATHPGIDAILVCGATLIVILGGRSLLGTGVPARALAKVGDFSYSLYLVHWPIFAFINNVYQGRVPAQTTLLGLVLALALGYLLYRTVERPVRRSQLRLTARTLAATLVSSLILVTAPWVAVRLQRDSVDYAELRRPNYGFGRECEYAGDFDPKPGCANSPNPRILVWGDSYAMHLVPGIAATAGLGVIQATRSVCGPFLDVAPIRSDSADYGRHFSEGCIRFNGQVLAYLARTPSVEIVVLSSPFDQYVTPGWSLHASGPDAGPDMAASVDNAVSAMRRTAVRLRQAGKRVVVVAPPPSANFDIAHCLERKLTGRVVAGAAADCELLVSGYRQRRAAVLQFLAKLPAEAGVDVIAFDDFLCGGRTCMTTLDGTLIYRDTGHLSYEGSRLLARRIGLVDRVLTVAK